MRGTTTTARGPVPRARKMRSRRPSGRRDPQKPWTSPRGPVTPNTILYNNTRRDRTTGNYQLGSRTYDPTKAAFTTPDTYRADNWTKDLSIGTDPLTTNRYAYVNGDPVNNADPSGHRIPCEDEFRTNADARIACQRENVRAARATATTVRKKRAAFGNGPAATRLARAASTNCVEQYCGFLNGVYLPPSFFDGLDPGDVSAQQASLIAAFVGLADLDLAYFSGGGGSRSDEAKKRVREFLQGDGPFRQARLTENVCRQSGGTSFTITSGCSPRRECSRAVVSAARAAGYGDFARSGVDIFEGRSPDQLLGAVVSEAGQQAFQELLERRGGSAVARVFLPVAVAATIVDGTCSL